MSLTGSNILPNLYKQLLLRPLGLNADNSMVLWLLLFLGAITVGGFWYFDGHIPAVLALLYIAGIAILSFLRLDYSLYVLIFGVLLFDQFGIPGFDPLTYQADYFSNINEISYIPFINEGIMNPIEIHLFFITFSLLFILAIKKDFEWRPVPMIPFLIFAIAIAFSLFYGISSGADIIDALSEIRALLYFLLLYLIVPQIVRSKEQIRVLVWIFICCISYKAFQAIERYITLGYTTGPHEILVSNEDPALTITLLMLLLGFMLFNIRDKQRLWLLILSPLLFFGFYLAMSTGSYISFMASLVVFVLLLPALQMWKLFKFAVPLVVIVVGYGAVFWHDTGQLGQPVQFVKSSISELKNTADLQSHYPIELRDIERLNLDQMVKSSVLLGTGFGKTYEQSLQVTESGDTLSKSLSTNGIFWVMIKMGALGFLALWFFFNVFVAKGVKVLGRLEDPYLKVILLVVLTAIINQMVISFFGVQLTYYRNMIYLGCLMGFLSTLQHYAAIQSDEKKLVKV